VILCLCLGDGALAQQISAPEPQTATIVGTVLDVNDGIVPGATIVVESQSPPNRQRILADDTGFFHLGHLNPGTPYHVTISASGLADWTSPEIILSLINI